MAEVRSGVERVSAGVAGIARHFTVSGAAATRALTVSPCGPKLLVIVRIDTHLRELACTRITVLSHLHSRSASIWREMSTYRCVRNLVFFCAPVLVHIPPVWSSSRRFLPHSPSMEGSRSPTTARPEGMSR